MTDFGLATLCDNQLGGENDVGTEDYKAPEILKGEPVDEKVDIWAAGVLAFYLFSGGAMPFMPDYDEDEDGNPVVT